MPDAVSGSGDISGIDVSNSSGLVLQGSASINASDGFFPSGYSDGWYDGSPILQGGVDQTVLQGDIPYNQYFPYDTPLLHGSIQIHATSGGLSPASFQQGGAQKSQPINQVVKLDINNTVVQPLEPCRSSPYLKLVFLPTDPAVKFKRELRRETSIPFPKPQLQTVQEFKDQFDGMVSTKSDRYTLRWQQVLPVVIEPQDSNSINYKSADKFDLVTAIPLSDENALSYLDISQLPLTQISKTTDIKGGTTDPDIQDYPLELHYVHFVDVDQSTGTLITKDPTEAGIFTGGLQNIV